MFLQSQDLLDKLAPAMVRLQGSGLVAVKQSDNSHLRSKYADLITVYDTVRQGMFENGLCVIQCPGKIVIDGDRAVIGFTSRLLHESGQWLEAEMDIPICLLHKMLNPAQLTGLAITYARRYSLLCLLGVATGDDDDAQRAFLKEQAPQARITGEETWQDLYDTGTWREYPVPGEETEVLGDCKASELKAAIKADSTGNNVALTAAFAHLLNGTARQRAASLVEALTLVTWNGSMSLSDMSRADMVIAYNSILALPKIEKGAQ